MFRAERKIYNKEETHVLFRQTKGVHRISGYGESESKKKPPEGRGFSLFANAVLTPTATDLKN